MAITAARLALIEDLNIEAEQGWLDLVRALTLLVRPSAGLQRCRRLPLKVGRSSTAGPAGGEDHAGSACQRAWRNASAGGTPAVLASAGQQALLIAVILAHARLQQRRLGRPPLMLLDDVAAHLDVERRLSLFEAVGGLGAQSWFSGTDIDDFSGLRDQPR